MIYATRLLEWQQAVNQKRRFDPKSKKDKDEYTHFLRHSKWKSLVCPFICEWPYLTVPDMIKDKITHSVLGVEKRTYWDR